VSARRTATIADRRGGKEPPFLLQTSPPLPAHAKLRWAARGSAIGTDGFGLSC
jgi:hypothetical protein